MIVLNYAQLKRNCLVKLIIIILNPDIRESCDVNFTILLTFIHLLNVVLFSVELTLFNLSNTMVNAILCSTVIFLSVSFSSFLDLGVS